jgi:hypothetical protein
MYMIKLSFIQLSFEVFLLNCFKNIKKKMHKIKLTHHKI